MGQEIRRAEKFAEQLVEVYGGELRSIALYGSAARGQFHEGVSDLNLLVVLGEVGLGAIRRGSKLARQWVLEGNPPPLLLGEEELRRSLDIFPVEYSDIREAHRILHGTDPFAGLEIDAEHMRLQCERELKVAQIRLRERFLISAREPRELGDLLSRSLSTFLVHFRAVLRLSGARVPDSAEEVVRATAERVGFTAAPLLEILRARRSGEPLGGSAAESVVAGYLEAVDRAVAFVDRLPTGPIA